MYAITTQSKSLGTRQALCLSLHSYESTSTFSQLAVSAPITSGQELVRKLVVVFQVINLTWARTASGNQVSQIFGNSRYVTFPGASLCTAPQPPPAQGHFLVPISSSKGYSPQGTNALHLTCFQVGPTDDQIDNSLGLFLVTHIQLVYLRFPFLSHQHEAVNPSHHQHLLEDFLQILETHLINILTSVSTSTAFQLQKSKYQYYIKKRKGCIQESSSH